MNPTDPRPTASGGPDDEWSSWAAAFHGPAPAQVPALDLAALRTRVRRETWKQWGSLAAEVAAGIFLVGFYARLLVLGAPGYLVGMAVVNFVFVVVWLAVFVGLRRATWRQVGATTRDFLTLTRRRRRADVRFRVFVRYVCAFFAVVCAAWAPFVLADQAAIYRAEPWRAVVGFGGIYVILGALWVWNARKLARSRGELRQLDEAARDLDETIAGGGDAS